MHKSNSVQNLETTSTVTKILSTTRISQTESFSCSGTKVKPSIIAIIGERNFGLYKKVALNQEVFREKKYRD